MFLPATQSRLKLPKFSRSNIFFLFRTQFSELHFRSDNRKRFRYAGVSCESNITIFFDLLVLVGMHIELLEEVHRELKDAPLQKVKLLYFWSTFRTWFQFVIIASFKEIQYWKQKRNSLNPNSTCRFIFGLQVNCQFHL